MHVIAAKAVCFKEALQPEFKAYQHQIVLNAAAMAKRFMENGVRLVSGGTDNHLMLVDVYSKGKTGKEVEALLDMAHITVNKNTIPNDPQSPFITSGIRVGTPAVTTRGFKEAEMLKIAKWMKLVATDFDNCKEKVSEEVMELCRQFPIYE